MINLNGMAKLLSGILEDQIESGQYGVITEKRLREALTTGPVLNDKEQSLLLLSPVVRADYQRVSDEIKFEVTSRLQRDRVDLELLPLAAATDEDKIVMHGNGFDVTLYRQEDLGIPWVILVQVGTSYTKILNPMTVLQLVDSGGLEWLRGTPDANGEITAMWNDPETDILSRSRRFSLILQPV